MAGDFASCDRRGARQLTWAEEPVQLFHYRDRDQVEGDMVLEHAAGTVVGVEPKELAVEGHPPS